MVEQQQMLLYYSLCGGHQTAEHFLMAVIVSLEDLAVLIDASGHC